MRCRGDHVGHGGHGGRGEHGSPSHCGQDRTGQAFKLDFPGNL